MKGSITPNDPEKNINEPKITSMEEKSEENNYNLFMKPKRLRTTHKYIVHNKYGPLCGRSIKKWTDEEDKKLIELAHTSKGKHWKWVASHLQNKTENQCRSRWERIKPGMKQGRWTPQENDLVRNLYKKHGEKWAEIARHLEGRSGKQVRGRVKNVISDTHATITKEQDELIYKLYLKVGPKWTWIRNKYFPNRSADFIKNRFYSNFQKMKTKFKGQEKKIKSQLLENIEETTKDISSHQIIDNKGAGKLELTSKSEAALDKSLVICQIDEEKIKDNEKIHIIISKSSNPSYSEEKPSDHNNLTNIISTYTTEINKRIDTLTKETYLKNYELNMAYGKYFDYIYKAFIINFKNLNVLDDNKYLGFLPKIQLNFSCENE